MSILDWIAARVLDAQIAADEMPPAWMVFLGLTLFGGAVATLTWLVVAARDRRRGERNQPEPGNLVDARPWLAEEGPEVPARYRGRRRAPREHVVPAHPTRAVEPVTALIPKVSDDPDATAILTTRGGGR